MAQITELITKFGFSGSLDPLKDYNNNLGKGIGFLAGMTAALGVAVLGINKWVTGVSQSLQPLIDLNAQTGVSVEKIQELSFAAEQSSSSSEALFSSLSGLGEKIGEAAQKGSEDFSRLGISVRDANGQVKSTDSVLSEVGTRFRQLGLSMSEQQGFAAALGIDPGLLSMMNKTGAEMASLRGEAQRLGVLTAEQVKSAQDYNDALGKLGFGMESVKRFIAVGLAPELTEMAKDFTDLLAANKDWIIDGIKATVGVLGDMVDALIRVAPFIAAVGAAFLLAKVYTLGFSGVLALVLSPAILIAAGIGAVLLILDDLIVAFQGGKSVIRDFFLEFFGWDIQPMLLGIVDAFKDIGGGALVVFDAIKPIAPLLITIGAAFAAAAVGPALFGAALALATSPITLTILGIAGILWVINDLKKAFNGGDSKIMDFFGMIGDMIEWVIEKIVGLLPDWAIKLLGLGGGGNSPGPGRDGGGDGPASQPQSQAFQPGGATNNTKNQSSTVEQTVNMDIRTSDPEKAGKAASDGLQRQLQDALNQTRGRGGH